MKELYNKYVRVASQEDWNRLVYLLKNTDFYLWLTGEKLRYSDYYPGSLVCFHTDNSITRINELENDANIITIDETLSILSEDSLNSHHESSGEIEKVLRMAEEVLRRAEEVLRRAEKYFKDLDKVFNSKK